MSSSTCASKPAEKKIICGAKSSSAGSQWRSTASRKPWLPVPAGERHVDHVRRGVVGAAVRVERVLERARHQHALVVGEDVLGAVAVVHVEVDDRHALEAVRSSACIAADGDVVEDAEAHRARARRVMARRAHAAEGALGLAARPPGRWRAPPRRRRAAPHPRCSGSSRCRGRGARCRAPAAAARIASMYSSGCTRASCSTRGERRVVVREIGADPGGDQLVVDGGEPRRALRVVGAPCRASCSRHG